MSAPTPDERAALAHFLDRLAATETSVTSGMSYGADGSRPYWTWWQWDGGERVCGEDVDSLLEHLAACEAGDNEGETGDDTDD